MQTFENTETNDGFSGIISYYQQKLSNKVIKVSASSIQQSTPERIIDYQSDDYSFMTRNSETDPQWVEIEFREAIISVSSYTIRTSIHQPNHWSHLRSWTLFGSIDRHHWEELDSHLLYNDLNKRNATKNFECQKNKNHLYRFFRIQQTGKGFNDTYGFGIRQIEFFGHLFESDYVPLYHPTISKLFHFHTPLIFILFFILK